MKRLFRALGTLRAIARHPLHRGREISAIIRWLRLVLSSQLVPTQHIVIPFIDDAVLSWPRASTSVMICARYGLGEYADMAFCLHLLRPADLFCDVGANAGVYTILAARAVGCTVVAAEPVPKTFDLLMQNIYANGVSDRVDARRMGVGSESGRLHFTSSRWSYNHVVTERGDDTVEVDVAPLDTILAGRIPFAVKIDVEGFEAKVVRGARDTLADPTLQAVLVEMYAGHVEKYGDKLEEIRGALSAAGLSGPYWYDPASRRLIEAGHQERMKFNQIFIRDIAFVTTRLSNAARYEVHGAWI